MKSLQGYSFSDGSVCLLGDACQDRMERNETLRPGTWPWRGPVMIGDVRASVAWPEYDEKHSEHGQIAVAVVGADGLMRVVQVQPFERVGTILDAAGNMSEGLGLMLRDVVSWGVRTVAVQADDATKANDWWTLMRQDPVIGSLRVPADPVVEIETALRVWREMEGAIVVPVEYSTGIKSAIAQGRVSNTLRAVAMLAMSYKLKRQQRYRPDDRRWEAWN